MKKNVIFLCVMALFFGSVSIASPALMDKLVAYYPFNGNANDGSGNGLNGTIYGATLAEDRFGNFNNAYYFDGVNNNIIELPSNEIKSLLDGSTAFTAAVWIYNDGPGDPYRNILRICDTGGDSRGLMFRIGASSMSGSYPNRLEVLLGTIGYQSQHIVSATDISTDYWMHLATVYDGSNLWLYIDGEAPSTIYRQGVETSNGVAQTGLLTMGNSPAYISAYNTENFNGKIDDIFIYDRALSASEINELYTAFNPVPIPSAGWLLGSGLIGLVGFRERIKKAF